MKFLDFTSSKFSSLSWSTSKALSIITSLVTGTTTLLFKCFMMSSLLSEMLGFRIRVVCNSLWKFSKEIGKRQEFESEVSFKQVGFGGIDS